MRKRIFCFALIMAMLMQFAGCKIGGKEVIIETKKNQMDYVFSVGDAKCYEEEAKLYLSNYKNIYGIAYGVDLWETGIDSDSLEEYVRNISLDELTKVYCMNVVAAEQGIVLSESEMSKASKAASEYYKSLSKDEIKYMGVDLEKVEQIYEHYALAEKLYKSITEDINSEISDDDARVIRIQQVHVADRELAEEIAEKIEAGYDFSSIAGSYPNNTSADFTVGRGELPEEVELVAYDLNDEEISEMIMADGEFYYVKCLSKMEEELTEANKQNILIKREKEQFDKALEEFVGDSIFFLNEPIWDKIVVESDVKIETDSFFEVYNKYFK